MTTRAFLLVLAAAASAAAGAPAVGPGEGWVLLGTVRPRHAREIESSNWSVGAETMDRDYTVYRNWRKYLGPLGVRKARIQSGWAKTEKTRGVYDWAWLDEIIPDMAAQGVEPWVCLCYGNPVYPGGGGTGLGGGLPSSPEALKAWDAFVAAFVGRFGKCVDEWEVWNEPRGGTKAAGTYAAFLIRTAEVIRRRQPKAKILCMAGGAFDAAVVKAVLERLQQRGKLRLVDEVTYHPYSANPDSVYGRVAQLRKTIAAFSDRIGIRQGENGAPSRRGSFGALSGHDWTERRQAKWALRRLLGDLGRDVPSSYFAICDMAYRVRPKGGDSDARDDPNQARLKVNYKGLLAINPDRTVHHAKQAYRAVQHVTAIFDETLRRMAGNPARAEPGEAISVFAYEKGAGGPQVVTLWRDGQMPTDGLSCSPVTVTVEAGRFDDPVYVDMLSGKVHQVPAARWSRDGGRCTFRQVPVGDWPVLIADRAVIGKLLPPQ
ncbi:MAG: hypothetical protein WBF17_16425 [Phycisphaerae bacterium]